MIAQGDEAAFGRLFHSYLPLLLPFAVKFTRSEAAAEELIQEVFIRIWLHRDKLAEIEHPKSWIYKVASNECYAYLRKQLAYARALGEAGRTSQEAADSTTEYLQLKELQLLVAEAIEQMPAQRKKIYRMSRDRGMSIEEIARELDLSASTVKNVLVTANKFIRAFLKQSGHALAAVAGVLTRL